MATIVDEFAKTFNDAVRRAFMVTYGEPSSEEALNSIRTSWSKKSVLQGWTDPSPMVVVVGTEHGWIYGPHSSKEDMEAWNKTMELLEANGWGKVKWFSLNSGVQAVMVTPPEDWMEIIMKRVLNK